MIRYIMFKINDVLEISSKDSFFRVYKDILISGDERLEFFINSFIDSNLLSAVLEGDNISFLWKEFIPENFEVGKRIEFSYSDIIDGERNLILDEFRVKNSKLI